jgi:hypothetical protein
MSQYSLKIEIAGLCAEIFVKNLKLFYCLKSNFKNFFSINKANLIILVEKPLQLLTVDKEIFNTCSFSPNRVSIAESDGKYLLLAKRSKSIQVLGLIELEKRLCRLFSSNSNFSEMLFVDSIRGCLHIFLESLNGVLLHASGAIYKKRGYLFTGPAECGKSTAVKLLKDATVLSDECIVVKRYRSSYYIFGTPFHDNNNRSAILKGIFFPRKAKKAILKKVASPLAMQEIFSNIYHSILDGEMTKKRLDTIAELSDKVPCYEIHFSLNSSIWESIKNVN